MYRRQGVDLMRIGRPDIYDADDDYCSVSEQQEVRELFI